MVIRLVSNLQALDLKGYRPGGTFGVKSTVPGHEYERVEIGRMLKITPSYIEIEVYSGRENYAQQLMQDNPRLYMKVQD